MDAHRDGKRLAYGFNDAFYIFGERSPVCIAKHDALRACVYRRYERVKRVFPVKPEAVEKMFRLEDNALAGTAAKSNAFRYHPSVFLRRCFYDGQYMRYA